MNIEKVPISSLVFDPSNARLHDQKNLEAIKGSLAKFGQRTPIVVDERNIILKGNGTAAAAKELGWPEIHVIRYSDLTETQKTAYAIADNRAGELALWDDGALTKSLLSLQAENFDLGAIGFDDEDLLKLFKDIDAELDNSVPIPPQEWLVVIQCQDEAHQMLIYEEMQQRGEQCKIM